MELQEEERKRRLWWLIGIAAILCFFTWGYFGTGASTVLGCRLQGGTPTEIPTTIVVSSDRDRKAVPVLVTRCVK